MDVYSGKKLQSGEGKDWNDPQPNTKKSERDQMLEDLRSLPSTSGLHAAETQEMASENMGADRTTSSVTMEELTMALTNLEMTFLDKISSLMKPFYEHLDIIQKNLTEMKNVAEGAMNNSLANQLNIQQMLVMKDLLTERTMHVDVSLRQNNLKLRGLEEKIEEKGDLMAHISSWLLQQVGVENDISLVITKAFRLGSPATLKTLPSRDILITVLDIRYKKGILNVARKNGCLKYKGSSVEVYLDLPKEALLKRHELKPITNSLVGGQDQIYLDISTDSTSYPQRKNLQNLSP
ncbi:UNVERIFIED_CONTAM: hypothetical protein K2H54_054744 [Gekko kuhli]